MDDRHARRRRRRGDPRRRPLDGFRASSMARFTRLVGTALAGLPADLARTAAGFDVVVVEVPPTDVDPVPLASLEPGPTPDTRGRLVLYRRPIEARATSLGELRLLIADVLEEELDGA